MKEKDLPIDLTKHKVYSKSAKKCVQKLLRRYYDEQSAAQLWEKVQLQYCEYLKDEPALKDLKITTSIYDPILIFAWYAVIPEKPPLEEVQPFFRPLAVHSTASGRIKRLLPSFSTACSAVVYGGRT